MPQPPPPGQPWGPQPLSPGEEQGWGVACHLGGAFLSFLVPLIVWLVFRDRSRMIDDHGKTALNFQITLAIAYAASVILILVSFGLLFPLIFAVLVVQIVFAVIATVAAYQRQPYTYPVAIPFIR